MAKEKRCKLCREAPRWNEEVKNVKGAGPLCSTCRECRECSKTLPLRLIGLKGMNGRSNKLCPACFRKDRAERRAVERRALKPVGLKKLSLAKNLIVDDSTKESRLIDYVRLEKQNTDGTTTFIEFGTFAGNRIYTDHQRFVYGVRTMRYVESKKPGVMRIDRKSITVVKQTLINMMEGPGKEFDSNRMMARPIDLLRRLGYRATARRKRGKNVGVGRFEAMTYADEFIARRGAILEDNLSGADKKRLERLKAQNERAMDKLNEFETNIIDETVEEAHTPEALEAMVAGFDHEALAVASEEDNG